MSDEASIRRLRRRLKRAVDSESLGDVQQLLSGRSKSAVKQAAISSRDGSTLLHVACSRGLEQIAVLLVSSGVSVSSLDGDLNTPLHCAVKRLESHRSARSWRDMGAVILTLAWADAAAYDAENSTGMSPRRMLQPLLYSLAHKHRGSGAGTSTFDHRRFVRELGEATEPRATTAAAAAAEEEAEWQAKLMHSVMEDVDEADGSEWRFFDDGYQFESLDDYMTRLGRAASRRQRERASDHPARRSESKSKSSKGGDGDEPRPKRKLGPLKPEVLAPSATARRHRLAHDHDMQFLQMLRRSKEKDARLYEYDIPWPCRGSAGEMAELLVEGVERGELRQHIRHLLRRWHPDKFSQHLAAAIAEEHRERVIGRVTALAQALTGLLPSA